MIFSGPFLQKESLSSLFLEIIMLVIKLENKKNHVKFCNRERERDCIKVGIKLQSYKQEAQLTYPKTKQY